MRLLDRYLFRELLLPFAYCLGAFFLFWNTFDLFGELNGFRKRQLTFFDVVEYYVLKTPEQLTIVVPVALLLALLYALSNHARHHELVAMRAAGVSLARLSMPYFAVGVCLSLVMFAINELWLPRSLEATDAVLTRRLADSTVPTRNIWASGLVFNNQRDARQWHIESYNRLTHQMVRPRVIWTLPDGSRREFSADAGGRSTEGWVFTNVQELVFLPRSGEIPLPRTTPRRVMTELTETPQQIKSQIKINKIDDLRTATRTQLSIREIQDYFKWNQVGAKKRAMLMTKLHGRLASPWTCLVVVLIALPFGTISGRRNVYVGVASSIVICFVYFVLAQFSLALGSGGYLPPILAAWAPNILFAATGILLTWRNR